jgi:hypothetical protein
LASADGQAGSIGDGTSTTPGLNVETSAKQKSLLDRLKAAAQESKEQDLGT